MNVPVNEYVPGSKLQSAAMVTLFPDVGQVVAACAAGMANSAAPESMEKATIVNEIARPTTLWMIERAARTNVRGVLIIETKITIAWWRDDE